MFYLYNVDLVCDIDPRAGVREDGSISASEVTILFTL